MSLKYEPASEPLHSEVVVMCSNTWSWVAGIKEGPGSSDPAEGVGAPRQGLLLYYSQA